MELLGYIDAADEPAAIALAIEVFTLNHDKRRRLAVHPAPIEGREHEKAPACVSLVFQPFASAPHEKGIIV
jgi:hypothetical protein